MRRNRELYWLLGLVCVVALSTLVARRTVRPSAEASTTLRFTAEKKARHYEFRAREGDSSWVASWVHGESDPITMRGKLRPNELRGLVEELQDANCWALPSRSMEVGEECYSLTLETDAGTHTLTFSGRPDRRYGAILDRLTRSRVYDASELPATTSGGLWGRRAHPTIPHGSTGSYF